VATDEVGPFDVKYELGHSYRETYVKTEWFCPACGNQAVWVEKSGGDYYEGPRHVCTSCDASFTLPRCEVNPRDWQTRQRVDAINQQPSGTVRR
jgi:transposase-like protein